MSRTTINMDCTDFARVWAHCELRAERSQGYIQAMGYVYEAEMSARRHKLCFNRKTHVLRDDRLGVLSRPVNPSEWQEATLEEAREMLADEIWSDAVRRFNIARREGPAA